MITRYARTLLNKATEKSVALTDRISIMIVPFTTMALWASGAKMTESIQETIWSAVAITVLAVVVLRFLASGYLVWRDDQRDKAKAEAALNAELERYDRLEREHGRRYATQLRAELSESLSRTIAIVELLCQKPDKRIVEDGNFYKEFISSNIRTRQLINALSYDLPLRICAFNLARLTVNILHNSVNNQPIGDDWTKLQIIKKPTFRVLHKIEDSETLEILSMLEVEEVMGIDPEAPDSMAHNSEDLAAIEKVRSAMNDPKLREMLRSGLSTRAKF